MNFERMGGGALPALDSRICSTCVLLIVLKLFISYGFILLLCFCMRLFTDCLLLIYRFSVKLSNGFSHISNTHRMKVSGNINNVNILKSFFLFSNSSFFYSIYLHLAKSNDPKSKHSQ